MARKSNKVKEVNQTNGKFEPELTKQTEKPKRPLTLDQLWGETAISKYKTTDVNEYQNVLLEMNKAELQHHALKVGVMPVDDVPRLRRSLLAEFNRHQNDFKEKPEPLGSSKKIEITPEVKKILSEGI